MVQTHANYDPYEQLIGLQLMSAPTFDTRKNIIGVPIDGLEEGDDVGAIGRGHNKTLKEVVVIHGWNEAGGKTI